MAEVNIRPAVADDQSLIKEMVRGAQLDPTALHWSHFLVAEQDGDVVGIGQIRPYRNCRELGSLVVRSDLRSHGVGGQIIRALLERETGDVYLECRRRLAPYYTRFGFEVISWKQAPMPLKLKAGFGSLMGRLFGMRLAVMRRRTPD